MNESRVVDPTLAAEWRADAAVILTRVRQELQAVSEIDVLIRHLGADWYSANLALVIAMDALSLARDLLQPPLPTPS